MIQRTTRWAIAVLALCLATACDDGDDATADGTDAAVEGGGGAGGDMPADGAGGSGGNGSGGSGTGGEADPYADWPETTRSRAGRPRTGSSGIRSPPSTCARS
jgi:hypothetical protein